MLDNLPFQMARGVAYLVGGVLLAGGALLVGVSVFWLWFIWRAPPDDMIGILRIPLIFAGLLGCAIAGGGLLFISRAQDATPGESVRALVATLGTLFLLPGLPLLVLGAYGVYLFFAPDPPLPPGVHHNLGQGFDGALLMIYCGLPGLVLGAIGAFLLDRARRS